MLPIPAHCARSCNRGGQCGSPKHPHTAIAHHLVKQKRCKIANFAQLRAFVRKVEGQEYLIGSRKTKLDIPAITLQ
eukprot:1158014-Pelagomonas_calceolata.AAC.3